MGPKTASKATQTCSNKSGAHPGGVGRGVGVKMAVTPVHPILDSLLGRGD